MLAALAALADAPQTGFVHERGNPEPASYREPTPPEAPVLGPRSTMHRLFRGRVAVAYVVAGAVTAGFAVGLLLRMTGLLGRHPFSLYLAAAGAAWALATLATSVPRPLRLRRLRGGRVRVAEGTRHAVEVAGGADALLTQLDPRGRVRRLTLLDERRRPVLSLDTPDEETLATIRRLVAAPVEALPVRARIAGPEEGARGESLRGESLRGEEVQARALSAKAEAEAG